MLSVLKYTYGCRQLKFNHPFEIDKCHDCKRCSTIPCGQYSLFNDRCFIYDKLLLGEVHRRSIISRDCSLIGGFRLVHYMPT